MRRITAIVLLALVLLSGALAPAQLHAQERTRCFPETGYCVSGAILSYWERNGGLPVFGYPISPVRVQGVYDEGPATWTGPIQWFERDRLEDHGAQGVMAGRLGAEMLETQVTGLVIPPSLPVDGPAPDSCRYFAITRHTLCQPFLGYWERSGGLERFGYPLSEPFVQTIGSWRGTVQYFERRRMELHEELPGRPVLLGLLGREWLLREPSQPCATAIERPLDDYIRNNVWFRSQMGCPRPALSDLAAAEQYFEKGVMVYVAIPHGNTVEGRIYVVRTRPLPVEYTVYADTWREGQPETAGLTPPPGLIEPKRGFGKLWRENPDLREMLGWATGPERAERATFQEFTASTGLLWLRDADFVYAFGPGRLMTASPRVWR
ncbi:MAG TPA: hypothetical protein VFS21_35575 [Roseiflexaceae bacterium]|nr:hypothetical protein [Roseiflexaceae bacterium]